MDSFFWLYLTINAPDFRLILLDRNTFEDIYILIYLVLNSSFIVQMDEPIWLNFETKIYWVMTNHLNKYFRSEKLDQAPLNCLLSA